MHLSQLNFLICTHFIFLLTVSSLAKSKIIDMSSFVCLLAEISEKLLVKFFCFHNISHTNLPQCHGPNREIKKNWETGNRPLH